MRKLKLTLLAALFLPVTMFSQTAEITGVKNVSISSSNSISTKYDTKGYYMFYKLEKADKGFVNYKLEIFNDNLAATHSVVLKKPKNSYLLEGKFNGTHFCFSYMNYKLKTLEYDVYDLEGKKTGSYTIKDIDKNYFYTIYTQIQAEDSYYSGGVLEVPNKGFVLMYAKDAKGLKISVDMIDNTGKKKWTVKSGNADKAYENANLLFADEENVFLTVDSKPSAMSKEFNSELLYINVTSGKVVSKTDFSNKTHFFWPFGVDFDETNKEYLVYGEYYGKKNGKLNLKAKEGFFVTQLSKDGKLSDSKTISWQKDFKSKISVSDKGKMEDGVGIFVHKILRLKNGKYYVVAEQFNKTASGAGIASAVLSGGNRSGVSTSQVTILNMIVITLTNDFKVEDVNIIEKKKSRVLLPPGAGYVNENALGLYVKTYGGFDYNYTSVNRTNDNFNIVYVNYDKSQKESKGDSKYYTGIIGLDASEKVTETKLNLKTKPTFFNVMRSKAGYIILFEYFKKQKKATFRMEKLDI